MTRAYPGKTIVGLTGNIAVGKSLVMGMLSSLGAATIDADRVAHEAILRGGPAFDAVLREFGAGVLGADGQIDRSALGNIVFSDAEKLRRLEAISHPAIRKRIDGLIRDAREGVIVIEAIKLLEGSLKDRVDAVLVVDAAPSTQLRRLMERRGMSEAEALRRIQAQNPQSEKLRQADVIISNNGDVAETLAQVERAWFTLTENS